MKSLFADYKTPTMHECEMVGREIGLAKRVIQVYFQNARAKSKKALLALQKASGQEPEPPKLPEECKLCGFKYSHKYSVQDHIFTKKHIDMIKVHIESGKPGVCRRPAPQAKLTSSSSGLSSPAPISSGVSDSIFTNTNIPEASSSMNGGEQAMFLQQLQLLQMVSGAGASGSYTSSSTVTDKDSFSATNTTNTTTTNISGSTNNSGLSAEEINLLQLYGLGTSTNIMRPSLSASSGKWNGLLHTFTTH